MKESQKFIIDHLKSIHSEFDNLKIRYEYRDYMDTHFIEILPIEIFESNEKYMLNEICFQNEFESKFGDKEDVLFLSSNSLNKIEKPFFTLGYGYEILDRIVLIESIYSNFSDNDYTVDSTSYALAA